MLIKTLQSKSVRVNCQKLLCSEDKHPYQLSIDKMTLSCPNCKKTIENESYSA